MASRSKISAEMISPTVHLYNPTSLGLVSFSSRSWSLWVVFISISKSKLTLISNFSSAVLQSSSRATGIPHPFSPFTSPFPSSLAAGLDGNSPRRPGWYPWKKWTSQQDWGCSMSWRRLMRRDSSRRPSYRRLLLSCSRAVWWSSVSLFHEVIKIEWRSWLVN